MILALDDHGEDHLTVTSLHLSRSWLGGLRLRLVAVFGGRSAWWPGCRAGWAGFHGPAGCPFWS
jgi:hypothetical protein